MGEVNARQSSYQVSPNNLMYFVKKDHKGVIHSSPSWAHGDQGQLFQLPQRYLGVFREEAQGRILVDPVFLLMPWEYAVGSAANVPGLSEDVKGLAHHGIASLKLEEVADMAQGITGLQSRLVPALHEDMSTVLRFLNNKPEAAEKVRENYESIINSIHGVRFAQIVAQANPGDHFYWTERDLADKSKPMLTAVKRELREEGIVDDYPARNLGIYRGPADGTNLSIDSVVLLHLWDYLSTEEVELPEMRGMKLAGVTQGHNIHLDVRNALDIAFGAEGLVEKLVPELEEEGRTTLPLLNGIIRRSVVGERYSRLIRAIRNAEFGPSPRIEPMEAL